ncbi:MAG: site-specific integrase, partial [Desulfobacteraceae bacterium]
LKGGILAMFGGGIYTSQKCPKCGKNLKDNYRNALECPDHREHKATKLRVHFKGVKRRFENYSEAYGFLITLRGKKQEGNFDERDYRADKPLGFSNLADKYISVKETEVRCIRNIKNHMGYAKDFFGNQNIKNIQYADLEDFVRGLPKKLSGKSKKNILTTLHAFWVWVKKRRIITIEQMPEFPEIKYEMGWRSTISKDTQKAIIDEVRKISYDINPKIWIGIMWLARYVSIRPIEMIHIKEGDFDLSLGVVNIRYNKEKKPKIVPLLDEDIELVKSFPTALPHLYFFRHGRRKGVQEKKRKQFGKDYLYKWWKLACKNLGVENVDLYGGTRHSSVKALREIFTPDQIKKGTMHNTNVAFERYFQIELEDSRKIYEGTQGGKKKERFFPFPVVLIS